MSSATHRSSLRLLVIGLVAGLATLGVGGTAAQAQCPGAPGAFVIPGACSLTVNWLGVPLATGYEVYRSPTTILAGPPIATVGGGVTSYTDGMLTAGSTYYYGVRALTTLPGCPAGGGSVSTAVPGVPLQVAVGTPSNVVVTPVCVGFNATWSPVPGATSYLCETYYLFIGIPSTIETQVVTGTAYSYSGFGGPFASPKFKVTARNDCGQGPTVDMQAGVLKAPDTPGSISISRAVTGGVIVDWSEPSTATSYRVVRKQTGVADVNLMAGHPPLVDLDAPTDVGLTYRVYASNSCGENATPAFAVDPIKLPSFSILSPPQGVKKVIGENVTLTVVAGASGLTYVWRRAGVPLVNGGRVSGATTPTLSIVHLTVEDTDLYDVQVSSAGSAPVTLPAAIIVTNPCAADFNASGAATVQDIFLFLTAWFSGCP